MSTRYSVIESEKDIAKKAGTILSERFRAVQANHSVMYVVNDTVVRKSANSIPVVVKSLSGRNPEFATKISRRGTFRLRKRKEESTAE